MEDFASTDLEDLSGPRRDRALAGASSAPASAFGVEAHPAADDDEDMAGPRKGRRIDPSLVPPSLGDAAARLEDARRRNRDRAARFGTAFQEPNAFAVLGRTDARRLLSQHEPGLTTGFSTTSEDQEEKRRARAAEYGLPVFDYAAEPAKAAGLGDAELRLREARRARAAKFGAVDDLDVAVATAAAAALADAPNVGPAAGEARPEALHVRVFKYLPAATRDIRDYFREFRPSFVEWLNGVSVNVVFEDAHTAARALASLSEAIPRVPGVPEVHDCWRIALKPIVKRQTDRYAPSGSKTTLYLRAATDRDVKELADKSAGPRSQGTHSADGAYALGKPEDLASPALVATVFGETLRQAARALELPVAFRAPPPPPPPAADVEAVETVASVGAAAPPSRVITVVLPPAASEPPPPASAAHRGDGHDNRFAGGKRGRAARDEPPVSAGSASLLATEQPKLAASGGGLFGSSVAKVKGRGHARPPARGGDAFVAKDPAPVPGSDSMDDERAAAAGGVLLQSLAAPAAPGSGEVAEPAGLA